MIATAGGALFLTQLEQVVLGKGAPSSVQLVIQGSIIALGMALHNRARPRPRGAHRRARCGNGTPRPPTRRRRPVRDARPTARPIAAAMTPRRRCGLLDDDRPRGGCSRRARRPTRPGVEEGRDGNT